MFLKGQTHPYLIARFLFLLILFFAINGFGLKDRNTDFSETACKKIDIKADVKFESDNKETGTIVIDYKGHNASSLLISVVGPKKYYYKDLKESELKGLSRGVYAVVVVGRDESSNYCPTHIQVEI
jgi:hypothetical protein